MTKFEDIYEEAIDNFGLIASARAAKLGVTNNELVQYARRGRLEHVGQGLYRLTKRVPEANDPYALAVALVGEGAYLYGESVIAMLGLAPTNPERIHVASPKRVRRKLPDGIALVCAEPRVTAVYDGILSQTAADAIRSCMGKIMPERLQIATDAALREGYVTAKERDELTEELKTL